MNICFIGIFSDKIENEGYKKISCQILNLVQEKHNVLPIEKDKILSSYTWKTIREFKPDIIHYFTAPTLFSFLFTKVAKYAFNHPKTIISALHPYSLHFTNQPLIKIIIKLIKPDLIFTQCNRSEIFYQKLGIKTIYLPNGVNTEKFCPATFSERQELRDKYGIPRSAFVVLHVGHIRKSRGIDIFKRLQKIEENIQVIIVGSSFFKIDNKLLKDLRKAGCIVFYRYFECIEEMYKLADCYVFPTPPYNSILMPLSVLEAMSCGLPVYSTKFEGLIDNFSEGTCIQYFNTGDELLSLLRNDIYSKKYLNHKKCETRILAYDWKKIGINLDLEYQKIVRDVM